MLESPVFNALVGLILVPCIAYLLDKHLGRKKEFQRLKYGAYVKFMRSLTEFVVLGSAEKRMACCVATNSLHVIATKEIMDTIKEFFDVTAQDKQQARELKQEILNKLIPLMRKDLELSRKPKNGYVAHFFG